MGATLKLPFQLERPSTNTPAAKATDIDIDPITGLDATNVQNALSFLFANGGSGGGSGLEAPISQAQYDAIASKQNTLYFIVESGELKKIYYGSTLVARKKAAGEQINSAFPLVFPIVFG